jgi:hypothetical protein
MKKTTLDDEELQKMKTYGVTTKFHHDSVHSLLVLFEQ